MGKTIERCPLCGSENIEWMGDCFDENNPTPYHCHECDRFFGENTMKKYEIYDYNNEVIDKVDDIYEALGCAEANNAKFVLDTESNEVVYGSKD